MNNIDLRDKFKYKSFKLSSDNTVIYFELDQISLEQKKLCNYQVSYDNGVCKMNFDPNHFGPFLNIEVQFTNGETILLNPDISKLRYSQKITLTEIKL